MMAGRGRYTVKAAQVESIIVHRPNPLDPQKTQYLLRWRSEDQIYPPLSWHGLDELGTVLHLIEKYSATYHTAAKAEAASHVANLAGQKRKYSGNHGHQLPTPQSGLSPESDSSAQGKLALVSPKVFNARFERMEGELKAVPTPDGPRLDVRTLPTPAMLESAQTTDMHDAELAIHNRYVSRLRKLPGPAVRYVNDVDSCTPSLSFRFITAPLLRPGVEKRDELLVGCKSCKPNMGSNRGCEYTKRCDCLEFAAEDVSAPARTAENPTPGPSKRFPYCASGPRTGCLVDFYLKERHPIYECNALCACGPRCKNRNVQYGRRVPLEIFRTSDARGFGLRCPVPLRRGQFIDVYLGEVLTDAEATRREEEAASAGDNKASYLFSLDKFVGDDGISDTDCYVVDGEFFGGPTRFMNHCCQPNVQIHSVSYNKYDLFLYDLAFFACEDIPVGEELTFDYLDADDREAGGDAEDEVGDGTKKKVPCLCGAKLCRKFLWM